MIIFLLINMSFEDNVSIFSDKHTCHNTINIKLSGHTYWILT